MGYMGEVFSNLVLLLAPITRSLVEAVVEVVARILFLRLLSRPPQNPEMARSEVRVEGEGALGR